MDVHEHDADAALAERLAEVAQQVVTSRAPAAAVLHGGARRRNRRRVAAGTAVLLAGGLVVSWLAVLPDEDGGRPTPPAHVTVPEPPRDTRPPGTVRPVSTPLGKGVGAGQPFAVEVTVWGAAETEDEVWDQVREMYETDTELPYEWENGDAYPPVEGEDELPYEPGTAWFYVDISLDGHPSDSESPAPVRELGGGPSFLSGTNLGEEPNEQHDEEDISELVVVHVSDSVTRARLVWENGTVSEPELTEAAGTPGAWFVVAGPPGVDPESLHTYDRNGERTEERSEAW
ncbi:hypothetical protein [Streptomyces sp. 184]|uniref:hypothetical protein n=1 Tax=Streptomyces sp. 184 TaxID=1827526 RepID=UPI0038927DC3